MDRSAGHPHACRFACISGRDDVARARAGRDEDDDDLMDG
jgi:hypothetical protein